MAGKTTKDPEVRRLMILNAAYRVAISKGFNKLTRPNICKEAKISPSLLTYYFHLDDIKTYVLKRAKNENKIDAIIKD